MYFNYQTGKDFFLDNKDYILGDELVNQFLYTNAVALWDVKTSPNNYYIKVSKDGKELFMIKNNTKPLVLVGDESLVNEAVNCLGKLTYSFDGILGQEKMVESFKDKWQEQHGGKFILNTAMDIMVFKGVGVLSENIRVCQKEDISTLAECIKGFYKDIWNTDVSLEEATQKATEKIGNIYGYFTKGKCVSMVALSRETENYQSIGLAYTIPSYRGNGYMQELMSHCAKIIEMKNKTAQLHVDKANPISNHAYKKIGFVIYCDNIHYDYLILDK